jgi:hypothetical protein
VTGEYRENAIDIFDTKAETATRKEKETGPSATVSITNFTQSNPGFCAVK